MLPAASQWGSVHACTEFASDSEADNAYAHALHHALGFDETERVIFLRKRLS